MIHYLGVVMVIRIQTNGNDACHISDTPIDVWHPAFVSRILLQKDKENILKNGKLRIVCAFLSVVSISCAGAPDGVTPVTGFQLFRYLGTWYEIARLDHSFETGLQKVTATYTLREDGGVSVRNQGYDTNRGEWTSVTGRAYSTGESSVGQLKVSFFGPFYGGYNIIALDTTAYEWSLVCGPSRSYLWILARTPKVDEVIVRQLIEKARALDFPVEELIMVTHDDE